MSEPFPPVRALIAFEAVVRHMSFAKAADELCLTPSAVSHQISNLESQLGCQLLVRSSRGVSLTAPGDRYHSQLAGALMMLANAASSARESGIEALRVHSSPSFASLWLIPRLGDFLQKNKDIQLYLSASPTHSDFGRDQIDLDIRYGRIRWSGLVVETVFQEEVLPLASPRFLSEAGIKTPADLVNQPLIFSEISLIQWQEWFCAQGIGNCPSDFVMRFDRASSVLDVAAQGLGIALESAQMAQRFLDRGELQPVFADRKGLAVNGHHAVLPALHAKRDRVSRFLAWLRSHRVAT